MNLSECFKAICLHYGKASTHEGKPVRIPREYDPVIGKDVADWMRAYRGTHEDFQPLFTELTTRYSTNYDKLPDKAKLQAAAEALEERVPVVPKEPLPELADAEREAVVAGLGEIMMIAKHGRTVEQRLPYRDSE